MTLTISDSYRYALAQLAAEALFGDDATENPDMKPGLDAADTSAGMLVAGNHHASRFTTSQANDFLAQWDVVEHRSDTTTGFSGTLFRSKTTQEFVLSIRSTEFIDDAVRDNLATNLEEIKEHGWAFGQLDDLEQWYQTDLKHRIGSAPLTVTGYSLGGHLATAFNLLHRADRGVAIRNVATFNGAGVGTLGGEPSDASRLKEALRTFHDRRNGRPGGEALFGTASGRQAYRAIAGSLEAGVPARDVEVVKIIAAAAADRPADISPPMWADFALLRKAVRNIDLIQDYAAYLRTVDSGSKDPEAPKHPARIPLENVAAARLDYQLAMLSTATAHGTTGRSPFVQGLELALGGTVHRLQAGTLPNQVDLVGSETDVATPMELTSGTQYHWGQLQRLFIEDQPARRGSIVADVALSVAATLDVDRARLLDDDYALNRFGDTHSLTLVVDSLAVQNALATLDPSLTGAAATRIFDAASAAKARAGVGVGNQGVAEGDVLERVLTGLGDMLGLTRSDTGWVELKPSMAGGTWAELNDVGGHTGRESFYRDLETLTRSQAFKELSGKVHLQPSDASLGSTARSDFASLLALSSLSPTSIRAEHGLETQVETTLANAQNRLYVGWLHDRRLGAAELDADEAAHGNRWIADRATTLGQMAYRNRWNIQGVE